MQNHSLRVVLFFSLLASVDTVAGPSVNRVDTTPKNPLPLASSFHGRMLKGEKNSSKYQWPGTYAEVALSGPEVYMTVGPEPVILHVLLDDAEIATLVKPQAGLYKLADIPSGKHIVRVESASENQAGPITFGGFATLTPAKPLHTTPRLRQIEFIGDSHTVGYGNTSPKRECTRDEVWETTDTSKAFGPIIAKHFDADYQVNAISGRGIVRNYGGFKADPLPVVYPFVLFDKATQYKDSKWQPEVIVIALGTNDFSTPLNPGEPWSSRDALHADYEATYLIFLQSLRARHPHAFLVLCATDMAEGEIQAEVKKVVDKFASGDKRIAFVPVNALAMTGCDWHPSVDDHRTIADVLIKVIDVTKVWQTH